MLADNQTMSHLIHCPSFAIETLKHRKLKKLV